MKNKILLCMFTMMFIMATMSLAPAPVQAVDQQQVNNAIGKTLFLPVRPFAMVGKYLSQFAVGLKQGNLKQSGQAVFLTVVSPVNLTAATAADLATITQKKSPYGPPGKEAVGPPF